MTVDNEKEVFEYLDDKKSWDIWVNNVLYPDPDWYPSNSSEVNVAWEYFARMDNGDSAMEAIEAILKEKLSLPNELVPWVLEACVAWREVTGNKRKFSTMRTQRELWDVFHAIYTLRMKGSTKKKATKQIAKQTGRSYKTLMETRKYLIFKEVKKSIEERLMISYIILKNKGRNKEVSLLVKTYPNFFKTELITKTFPSVRDLLLKKNPISD